MLEVLPGSSSRYWLQLYDWDAFSANDLMADIYINLGVDCTPPAPTAPSSLSSTTNSITYTPCATDTKSGIYGYKHYLDGTPYGSLEAMTACSMAKTMSGLLPATKYLVSYDTYDKVENISAASGASAICTKPPAPALSISTSSTTSGTNYTVSWGSVGTTSITYELQEDDNISFSSPVSTIYSTVSAIRSDTVSVTTRFYYRVRAKYSACSTSSPELGGWSNVVYVDVSAACSNPATPTGVSATAGCTGNSISWTNSPTATSHNVLRGTSCGSVVTPFNSVTTPYNDVSAVAGTTYNYWVVGVNSCGTSANSSCATAARLSGPAAPTGVSATAAARATPSPGPTLRRPRATTSCAGHPAAPWSPPLTA